jgi:hypothetical protein
MHGYVRSPGCTSATSGPGASRPPSHPVPPRRTHPCWPQPTTPRRLNPSHHVRPVPGSLGHNHGHEDPDGAQRCGLRPDHLLSSSKLGSPSAGETRTETRSFGHARGCRPKCGRNWAEVSASRLRLLTAGDKEHSRLERPLRGKGAAAARQGDPAQRAGHRRTAGLRRHPAPDPRIARSGPRRAAPASRRAGSLMISPAGWAGRPARA